MATQGMLKVCARRGGPKNHYLIDSGLISVDSELISVTGLKSILFSHTKHSGLGEHNDNDTSLQTKVNHIPHI